MEPAQVSFLTFIGCHKSRIWQHMLLEHHSFRKRPQGMCRVCRRRMREEGAPYRSVGSYAPGKTH